MTAHVIRLIQKITGSGFNKSVPVMSKKLFYDLKKCGLIFTSEGLRQAAIDKYGSHVVTFWKFDVDQMQKMGY